jgi:uncharacterized Zn-binding protein involved in type VI secretion
VPGQGRLGDKASVPLDTHGCLACPHPATGPAIVGSPDVNVNRLPALRVGDPGVHAACCAGNSWKANAGSATVFINGKAAHRMGDPTQHCGGVGRLIEGSLNVMVGESTSAGATASAVATPAPRQAPGANAAAAGGAGAVGAGANGAGANGASAGGAGAGAGGSASAAPLTRSSAAGPVASDAPSLAPPGAPLAGAPSAPDEPSTWLEVELIGEDGKGVVGERYLVIPPSGAPVTGYLDEDGRAILDGLLPGTCQISFPDLDSEAWQPAP